ncbi:MAG: MFS transporter [bacterium]
MKPEKVFVLYSLLTGLGIGFFAPNYALLVLSVGLTMPQVALINVVFFLVIVIMELPTGMLADGRSRAWSVWIGSFMCAVFHLAYGFVNGFWWALVCEVMAGVAMSFISGALEAWVTDALGETGDGRRLRRALASGAMAVSFGCLLGGVVGGIIGTIDPRLGFWIGGGFQLAAFVVARLFMDGRGEPLHRTSELTALKDSLNAIRHSRSLVWAGAAAAVSGLVCSFNHYWAPFFAARSGEYGLSYVWLVIYGGTILGSYAVRRWVTCAGHEASLVVAALLAAGLGLVVTPHLPGLVWPLTFALLHEVGRGAFRPLLSTFVQRRVASSFRATYGSLQSFIERGGFSIVLGLTWLLTRHLPNGEPLISVTWTVQGILLITCALLLALFRVKNRH